NLDAVGAAQVNAPKLPIAKVDQSVSIQPAQGVLLSVVGWNNGSRGIVRHVAQVHRTVAARAWSARLAVIDVMFPRSIKTPAPPIIEALAEQLERPVAAIGLDQVGSPGDPIRARVKIEIVRAAVPIRNACKMIEIGFQFGFLQKGRKGLSAKKRFRGPVLHVIKRQIVFRRQHQQFAAVPPALNLAGDFNVPKFPGLQIYEVDLAAGLRDAGPIIGVPARGRGTPPAARAGILRKGADLPRGIASEIQQPKSLVSNRGERLRRDKTALREKCQDMLAESCRMRSVSADQKFGVIVVGKDSRTLEQFSPRHPAIQVVQVLVKVGCAVRRPNPKFAIPNGNIVSPVEANVIVRRYARRLSGNKMRRVWVAGRSDDEPVSCQQHNKGDTNPDKQRPAGAANSRFPRRTDLIREGYHAAPGSIPGRSCES